MYSILRLHFGPATFAQRRDGITPSQSRETYKRWLRGDLLKLGKQETYLKEFMAVLAKSMGTPVRLQSLAQKNANGLPSYGCRLT